MQNYGNFCPKYFKICLGASDGVIRVFSADPGRHASQEIQEIFEVGIHLFIKNGVPGQPPEWTNARVSKMYFFLGQFRLRYEDTSRLPGGLRHLKPIRCLKIG